VAGAGAAQGKGRAARQDAAAEDPLEAGAGAGVRRRICRAGAAVGQGAGPGADPLHPATRGLNARGWEITPDAFRPDALPAHFSFNFRLVDEHGRQLGLSRSLTELRGEWGGKAKQEFSELHETPAEYAGMTDWSFGELPELMEVDVGGSGQMVLGYPGCR
jgi:hypothetical protein